MLTRVHHVGLVVRRLEDGLAFWQDVLGLRVANQATVKDQGVRAALLPIGRSEIELLEPIAPEGGVAKFLERRGEGLHHVCFETPDVAAELGTARDRGFALIDQAPRAGLAGMIGFLHPKGTCGVLVEFATPPSAAHGDGRPASGPLAGLALEEIQAHSRDPRAAADVFAGRLGLSSVAGAAPAVGCGGVRLVFIAGEAASEGLAGLVLQVNDLGAAGPPLDRFTRSRTAHSLALEPERCHGVPLVVRGS